MNPLKELDYEVNLGLIDAFDFGVPQHRRRVFFVGFLKSEFNQPTNFIFPKGNEKKKYIKDILEKDAEGYSISEHLQKTYIYKDSFNPQVVDFNSEIIAKTLCSTYHKIQRLTGTFIKDGKTGLRLLTKSECKFLMGFPPEFVVPVSRTQMYRQFGNSVVVPVVKLIAEEVYKVLNNRYSVFS